MLNPNSCESVKARGTVPTCFLVLTPSSLQFLLNWGGTHLSLNEVKEK
jgi:hypothetical protein